MTVLEREGYITQPYTSAGRIPTDLGYRYFVDHFTSEGALRVAQRRAVAEFFESAHRALEDLLHETSQLLSRVTDHTAMVVGPQPEVAHVRGVQLVTLHPGVVLVLGQPAFGVRRGDQLHGAVAVDRGRAHLRPRHACSVLGSHRHCRLPPG